MTDGVKAALEKLSGEYADIWWFPDMIDQCGNKKPTLIIKPINPIIGNQTNERKIREKLVAALAASNGEVMEIGITRRSFIKPYTLDDLDMES